MSIVVVLFVVNVVFVSAIVTLIAQFVHIVQTAHSNLVESISTSS
jgi:hypothetical protein